MRLFVALNLDPAERDRLHDSLAPLRQRDWPFRWVAPAALHLTLRFLGDVEGGEVQRIEETLRGVAAQHEIQTLKLGGLGAFPSLRRASIIWVGVEPARPLMTLQRETELALSRIGYGREPKPFRPHITVGRLRGGARPADIERAPADYDYAGSVDVETVELMRSHVAHDGARYETLLRVALGPRLDP